MTMTHKHRAALARLAREVPDWAQPCDHAQEHADHVAGSASDHQNAYAQSQIQHRSGMAEVQAIVARGLSVVVMSGPAYCRSTDALIGTSHHVVSYHLSRKVAERRAGKLAEACDGGEESFAVYPLPPPAAEAAAAAATALAFDLYADDVPF